MLLGFSASVLPLLLLLLLPLLLLLWFCVAKSEMTFKVKNDFADAVGGNVQ